MVSCPGGDYCALANARSIPVAHDIAARYADTDDDLVAKATQMERLQAPSAP